MWNSVYPIHLSPGHAGSVATHFMFMHLVQSFACRPIYLWYPILLRCQSTYLVRVGMDLAKGLNPK